MSSPRPQRRGRERVRWAAADSAQHDAADQADPL